MRRGIGLIVAGLAVLLLSGAAFAAEEPDPELVEQGAEIFSVKCYICHTKNDPYSDSCADRREGAFVPGWGDDDFRLAQNRFGPDLCGVFGAPAGRRAEEGFVHSPSFKKKIGEFRWTEENLDQWLTATYKFLPGTWMYLSIDDPKEREKIIAFLKTYGQ